MQEKLLERGMTVSACPLGTGVIIEQVERDGSRLSVHLTAVEAKALSSKLESAVQKLFRTEIYEKTILSLFARGLRVDQIAAELNLPIEKVREDMISRGLLP
jgi:DNA-binding NarL/FixJ family response regulator